MVSLAMLGAGNGAGGVGQGTRRCSVASRKEAGKGLPAPGTQGQSVVHTEQGQPACCLPHGSVAEPTRGS